MLFECFVQRLVVVAAHSDSQLTQSRPIDWHGLLIITIDAPVQDVVWKFGHQSCALRPYSQKVLPLCEELLQNQGMIGAHRCDLILWNDFIDNQLAYFFVNNACTIKYFHTINEIISVLWRHGVLLPSLEDCSKSWSDFDQILLLLLFVIMNRSDHVMLSTISSYKFRIVKVFAFHFQLMQFFFQGHEKLSLCVFCHLFGRFVT